MILGPGDPRAVRSGARLELERAAIRSELETRRDSLARSERMAREAPPRSRFAYAGAATRQRAAIARLERRLTELERIGARWYGADAR
jgi:hypothetical protein